MKIVCDFCKTEYTIEQLPTAHVQCAVCGRTWTATMPRRKNSLLLIIASLCALLSAAVFTIAVVTRHNAAAQIKNNPLVAKVSGINTVVDAFGVPHFVVSGTIVNQSDDIYGLPDLLIVSIDGDGNILARQKFLPPMPLLDAGDKITFSHTLSAPATGVKKVSVELMK